MISGYRILIFVALVAGTFFARRPADAQGFGLSISNSPSPVVVSNTISYLISVTNQTGSLVTNLFVTNAFSAQVQFLTAASSYGTNFTIITNSSRLVFIFPRFTNNDVAVLGFQLKTISAGFLTNTVTAAVTNPVTRATNQVVIQVTGAPTDLGVFFSGFPQAVLVGDQMTYNIGVTNAGTNAVPAVTLTNTLPPGVTFKSVSPGLPITTVGSNQVFNLGALAAGASTTLQFTVQPTNVGSALFSASIHLTNFADINPSNDSISTNILVEDFSGTLIATNVGVMVYDPQTGLMEQVIRLANIGTNAVASARVIVSGLTNRLYNANGTNDGKPFVTYGNTLDVDQSVDLVLEFFIPTRQPIAIANSQYTAVGIPAADFSSSSGTNGTFDIVRMVTLPDTSLLIEFESIPGRNYSIIYSDDVSFSNALVAQPSIIAPADKTQWIDTGPPKTIIAPASVPARYYKILQNP